MLDDFGDVPPELCAPHASRDQLDRFGEVDTVARLIGETMLAARKTIITNATITLSAAVKEIKHQFTFFGVSPNSSNFSRVMMNWSLLTRGAHMQAAKSSLAVELVDF